MLLYIDKVRVYGDGIIQARAIDDNLVDNIIYTDSKILPRFYYGIEEVNILRQTTYTEEAWNTIRA